MKFKNLLWSLVCGMFLFTACSDDDPVNEGSDATKVPQVVKDEFNRLYKDVTVLKWDRVKDYHVARFNGNISRGDSYASSAWFTSDGRHCQSEQEVEFNELPAMVREGFMMYKERMYPTWTVDDCEVLMRPGMGVVFVVEIEKGELEREISLSEYGDILKDVADDDDEDAEDILPVVVPEDLKVALRKLFPADFESLKIMEVEFDEDEISVDVLKGTSHWEIEFDLKYQWVSSEYEISVDELLGLLEKEFTDTKDHLLQLMEKYQVDLLDPMVQKHMEIEVEEHFKKGKSYSIEIDLGKTELEFHIDSLGNITVEEDD